jgi:hypothetical protein
MIWPLKSLEIIELYSARIHAMGTVLTKLDYLDGVQLLSVLISGIVNTFRLLLLSPGPSLGHNYPGTASRTQNF